MSRTVLHVTPHPDDELIGAPAALFALRDEGWRIVNLLCSFGREAQHDTRSAEAEEAARRTGFELLLPASPVGISGNDDHELAEVDLTTMIRSALLEVRPALVVSSSPHDRHHGHEVVARALRRALESSPDKAARWWMWAIWTSLELPTVALELDERRMTEILDALTAYKSELQRNDFRRLVRGRAEMNSAIIPELLFGFGEATTGSKYVEPLTELVLVDGLWMLGQPRWLDPTEPLAVPPTARNVTDWLNEPSLTQRFGRPGAPYLST